MNLKQLTNYAMTPNGHFPRPASAVFGTLVAIVPAVGSQSFSEIITIHFVQETESTMQTTTQLQTTGNATIIKATILASLTLGLFLLASLPTTAQADPLDKSSPKIAHRMRTDIGGHLIIEASGMYRDRGKSSPKIAHGMYRDRGKSSPKIAHGMYRDRGKSSPKIAEGAVTILENVIAGRMRNAARLDLEDAIFLALEMGEFEIADVLLEDLAELNAPIWEGVWEGGGGF